MDFFRSFSHPDELIAILRFKLGGSQSVMPKCDFSTLSPTLRKCYQHLANTSRSFAAVIQALDGDLRHAVCIFYLVLRALDTMEDDMTIPNDVKVPMLKAFHTFLNDPDWKYTDSKEKDRAVLEDFPTISLEFRKLSPIYRDVIADICKQMGLGMTVFLDKDINTMEEWNTYCHYVAGLVGIGLSRLFSGSNLEDAIVGEDQDLSNSMGLFLQKTNIIRDYYEDIRDEREFWPKSVWGKYAGRLDDLIQPDKAQGAVFCLNELVTSALELIPDCIKYLSRLQNQSIMNFCAIPQVMAIGTLERCYNNPKVFSDVVKIRKGEAVKMMMGATNMDTIRGIFHHFTSEIYKRIPSGDPHGEATRKICVKVLNQTYTKTEYTTSSIYPPLYVSCAIMLVAIGYQYWSSITSFYENFIG